MSSPISYPGAGIYKAGATNAIDVIASEDFRSAKMTFKASQDIPQCDSIEIQHLLGLVEALPTLKLYTRSSPQFQILRAVWNLMIKDQPIAICRPTSADQISKIVSYCANAGISIAVRSGGHDVWGRSVIADALIIDIRELDEMILAHDKRSLKIGGGVTAHNMLAFLETHGLSTAAGAAGTVGWTGWAIWGGYGLLDDWLGLGLDQIIGAKLVKADGTIVDAGEELLWAIRGAGGSFGVIVELTVRVYSMPKILAGFVVYKFDEIEDIIMKYQTLLDGGVPAAFCGRVGLSRRKDEITIAIIFLWPSENFHEGEIWHQRVRDLGTVIFDTVSETTFKRFQEITHGPVEVPMNCYTRSVSIRKFTKTSAAILHKYGSMIPQGRSYNVSAYICHGRITRPNPNSCFALREPHILLHINACTTEDKMHEAAKWPEDMVRELKEAGEVMSGGYVSFMGLNEPTENCYGDNWERMKAVKKRVDPRNVFRFAQPMIPVDETP